MPFKVSSFFIVAGLVALSAFGIFGISMASANGHHSCPLSALTGTACSPFESQFREAFHHLSGFLNAAPGIIGTQIVLFGEIGLLIVFAFLLSGPAGLQESPPRAVARSEYFSREAGFSLPQIQFLHWLALREARDLHALHRVHGSSRFVRGE